MEQYEQGLFHASFIFSFCKSVPKRKFIFVYYGNLARYESSVCLHFATREKSEIMFRNLTNLGKTVSSSLSLLFSYPTLDLTIWSNDVKCGKLIFICKIPKFQTSTFESDSQKNKPNNERTNMKTT